MFVCFSQSAIWTDFSFINAEPFTRIDSAKYVEILSDKYLGCSAHVSNFVEILEDCGFTKSKTLSHYLFTAVFSALSYCSPVTLLV